jgi:hypothetical protein
MAASVSVLLTRFHAATQSVATCDRAPCLGSVVLASPTGQRLSRLRIEGCEEREQRPTRSYRVFLGAISAVGERRLAWTWAHFWLAQL